MPKSYADTERLMRALKEECLWRQECISPLEPMRMLTHRLARDNERNLQSALGYRSPRRFERAYLNRHSTPFVAV